MASIQEGEKQKDLDLQTILIGIGIVLLIVAGFFYLRGKAKKESAPEASPEEILVQEEGMVKVDGGGTQALSEEEKKKIKEETEAVLSGEQVSKAQLSSPSGDPAQRGEAKRAFSDGKFYFLIRAKVGRLEKGFYYEGWLGNGDGNLISVGRMEVTDQTEGWLYYSSTEDKSKLSIVKVSREVEDDNPAIGEVIFQGNF